MKHAVLPFILLLICSVGFPSCKEETPQELIVNKWKLTEFIPPAKLQVPESFKQDFLNTYSIEFKEDSLYTHTLKEVTQNGTYSVSPDGKIIRYKINETGSAWVDTVLEVTKTKLSVVEENGIRKVYKKQ